MTESRVVGLALALTAIAAFACLWAAWCEFPFYVWNDVRLAPAFALRHGLNPYPEIGGGPLFTWIYGPVGIFLNLPATFAGTAQGALRTAYVINALTMLAPLALVFFRSAELRARGLAVCWLALLLAVLLLPRPVLVIQVADHAATAFGLLSCWCLARVPQPGAVRLAVAAALCATAIWSKQITLFLLPAQLIYLYISGPRRSVFSYVVWVAGFGVIALALFVALFGFGNLWLNLVAIPGRLPWAEFWPRLTMRPALLVHQIVVPAVLLCAIAWKRLWPGRDTESGRFFQITALAAAALLPVGIAAFFKIGGDTNLLHPSHYLLPAFLLAWLARDRAAIQAGVVRVCVVVLLALGARTKELSALPLRPFNRHYDSALELTARHPHTLWFPQHPVFTFYADGRLWHSEDGILTRHLAGYGLREADFKRDLPPALHGVVYPTFVEHPFSMAFLPEFSAVESVPYWTVYRKENGPDPE